MRRNRIISLNEALMLSIGLISVGILSSQYYQRSSTYPEALAFVSPQASAVFYSTPLELLWPRAKYHLDPIFDTVTPPSTAAMISNLEVDAEETTSEESNTNDYEGPILTELAIDIRRELENRGITLGSVEDLRFHGIDPNRAAVFAIFSPINLFDYDFDVDELIFPDFSRLDFVLILPVSDRTRVEGFVESMTEGELEAWSSLDANVLSSNKVEGIEDLTIVNTPIQTLYVVFTHSDYVLLSNAQESIESCILNPADNKRYFLSNDYLYSQLRKLPDDGANSTGRVMGFARLAGVPWSQYIVGKMRFSNDVLQFSTRFEGRGSRLRWVDEILSLESRQNAVAEWVPISSGASLSVSTLGMDFFRESLVDSLVLDILLEEEEVYLELVGQILASDYDVSSVSFSIVPGRESIPEWVLSLEMNESDAHPLVRDLQLHFRRNRDRAMLNAAWDEYREEGNADDPITYLDLIQSGYLADEGHNLWAEYSFDSEYGEVTGSGPESLEVLVDAYEQVWEDQTLSFILPPFTENDARYFLDEELDNIESLKDDEFRLCSAFRSGRLVFATDARTLIRLFSEGLGVIPNKLWSVTVQKFGSKQDLVRGLIRPTWAIDQGLLYESSDVQSFITRYLVDWDHYDTAFMSFGADQGRGDFYLDTTLIP